MEGRREQRKGRRREVSSDPTIHHPHGNLSPESQEAASSSITRPLQVSIPGL